MSNAVQNVVKKVAFVAGATGYVGREVVRELRRKHIETFAHVRPDSSELPRWRDVFSAMGAIVDTTPWSEEAMRTTLAALRPDLIFALLGTTRARARRASSAGKSAAQESYETVDFRLTNTLIRACQEADLRPRFVYLSSAGVGTSEGSSYLGVRARLERMLKAGAIPYTIARPSFITGPDREENRPGERIGAAVTDGLLAIAGAVGARTLRDRYRSNDAPTLAAALVRHALDPASEKAVIESEHLR